MASFRKKITSLITTSTLILGLLVSIPLNLVTPTTARAANPACAASMTASAAGLKAVPAHGKVFYIDSGVTPKVDAAYIGYRIQNSSGSTKTGLWVSVETFVGGKLSLANPLDQYQQMDPISNNGYKTAFYLLKAIGSTTVGQTHTLKIFDRRPDLTGATAVLTCDFTFTLIQETIKANANKVTSVSGALSPSTATLGGTLTVSVAGDTGKVGAGKTPDFSIIWVSPAAVSTWPTRSLRLESTSITLACSGNIADITLVDTLLQSTADTCFTSANGSWTGTYVFRIIGPGPASLTPSPIANIASGTQYKHSDISSLGFSSGINLSGVASSTFTVNVTASSTVVSSTSSVARVRYTITLSTSSTTAVEVDEVIDRPAAGTTLVTGSSKLNGTTISDPSVIASEANLSPPPVHYIGPFSVVSGTNVVITFERDIPCTSSATPYSNTAFAKTGDQILGSGTTTIPGVTVTTTTSGSSCGVVVTNNPQTISPTVQTSAATSVTASTAVLNGYANAYGGSGVTTYFKYSTDRNLVLNVTSTTSVSLTGSANETRTTTVSGLSSGTTYFFQAVVTSSTSTSYGATLSFTTDFVQALPTVVTSAGNPVASTSATLNGYVNPNLTSITRVQFIFGTTSASVTDNSSTTACVSGSPAKNSPCIVQIDDGTGSLTNLTLTGSGQTPVSYDVNGLTAGTTYYFKLQVLCTADTTYCPGGSVSGNVLQFKTGAPQVTTTEATLVAQTTATLNGSMSSTGSTVKYQFYYCAAAVGCTASALSGGTTVGTSSNVSNPFNSNITFDLTGLTGNTTYYYQTQGLVGTDVVSFGEIVSFTTLLITTSSLPGGTLGTAYTAGLTGSGGVGPYSWTSTTLPAGLTLSSSGVITGTPTSGGTTSVTFTMRDEYYGTTTTKTLNIVIKASVTYALNGGTGTLPTEVDRSSGETFQTAASTGISRTGYTFAGWNDGTSTYLANATYTMGTANITLTAQWTINTYTLTYNGNGNTAGDTPTAVTQNYNTTILVQTVGNLAKSVSGTASTFQGWNTAADGSGTDYAAGSTFTFTASRTLYAKWLAPGSKTVTFNSNYGTPVTSSQSASSTTALTNNSFTRTGYTFSGWGTDSSTATVDYANGANYDFLNDVTLYAKWTINSFTLTYVANSNGGITYGGSTGTPKTQIVNYLGNGAAVTATPNTGYSFTSWNDGNTNPIRTDLAITQSDTYTASFSINSYLITFSANGGSGGSTISLNYNVDAIPSKPSNPTRTGYTFAGWSTDGTTAITSYTVTGSATLLAVWTINTYTVTYDGNGSLSGSVPSSVTQNYNTTVTVSGNTGSLAKGTDNLASWNTAADGSGLTYAVSGTATFTLSASNITLYAQWTPAGSYTVTFNSNFGTPTTTTQTASSSTALTSNTFTRPGYNFSNWCVVSNCTIETTYNNGSTYSFSSSTTLYAQWTAISYTVTYLNGGGSGTVPTESNKTIGQTFLVGSGSTLSKAGSDFSGWNDGTTDYLVGSTYTMGAGNVVLTALWTTNSVFTITYSSVGSESGSSPAATTGSGAVTLRSNTGGLAKSGFNLSSWSTSANCAGTQYSIGGAFTLTSSITLYPCFVQQTQTSTPITVPRPPSITSISASDVCAIGSQLVITGNNLLGASVLFEGVPMSVLSTTNTSVLVALPPHPVGVKQIVVRNSDGMASTTIEYKFVESPVYVNFIYPSTFKGMEFTYTFTATNTEKYTVEGSMPKGISLNSKTGEVFGTPTVTGNYKFTIVASNLCDQTLLDVYMFVDKAIPQTYSCSVTFPVAKSNTILSSKLVQLRNCLDDIYTLSPATISPVIFISGGLPTGLTIEQSLSHPRYLPILDVIKTMKLGAQVYLGAFNGSTDLVQLIVYWPQP